jgi:hypothetical protein
MRLLLQGHLDLPQRVHPGCCSKRSGPFSDKLLERQRVSAAAGGKLELPGQGVPKLELGNERKDIRFAN